MATAAALRSNAERNPFSGKGLAVTVGVLLRPDGQTLGELADLAEVSRPLVTMVLNHLRRLDLVAGEVHQGRSSRVLPTRALFDAAAENWPLPLALVVAGHPTGVPLGGRPAMTDLVPAIWDPPPRAYVRSRRDAEQLLADAGGHLVQGGTVDWEIAVVDYPFEPGPLPLLIAAVELASTPRGREMLDRHAADLVMDQLPA